MSDSSQPRIEILRVSVEDISDPVQFIWDLETFLGSVATVLSVHAAAEMSGGQISVSVQSPCSREFISRLADLLFGFRQGWRGRMEFRLTDGGEAPARSRLLEQARCAGVAAYVERQAFAEDKDVMVDRAICEASTAQLIRRRIMHDERARLYLTPAESLWQSDPRPPNSRKASPDASITPIGDVLEGSDGGFQEPVRDVRFWRSAYDGAVLGMGDFIWSLDQATSACKLSEQEIDRAIGQWTADGRPAGLRGLCQCIVDRVAKASRDAADRVPPDAEE